MSGDHPICAGRIQAAEILLKFAAVGATIPALFNLDRGLNCRSASKQNRSAALVERQEMAA